MTLSRLKSRDEARSRILASASVPPDAVRPTLGLLREATSTPIEEPATKAGAPVGAGAESE